MCVVFQRLQTRQTPSETSDDLPGPKLAKSNGVGRGARSLPGVTENVAPDCLSLLAYCQPHDQTQAPLDQVPSTQSQPKYIKVQ